MRKPAFMKRGHLEFWRGEVFRFSRLCFLVILAISFLCIASTANSETLNLKTGWNLVSSRVAISSSNLSSWPVESVWKWSASSESWAVYLPQESDKGASYASTKGFSLISGIQPGEGFWVKSNSAFALNVSGTEVDDGNLSFSEKWNLKGLKTNNKVYVPEMFDDSTKVKSVWKWDNGNWAVYLPGSDTQAYATSKGFSPLSHILPNEGFWVNSNTNFQVDTSQSTLSDEEVEKAAASINVGTSLASASGETGMELPYDISSGLMKIQLFKKGAFEIQLPESIFKEGLYGSYSDSLSCTYGGSMSFSASWTGSDYPSSEAEVYNPKLSVNFAKCKTEEGTFNGNMTIELYGYLSNPTGGTITVSQLSGNIILQPYGSVTFNFSNFVTSVTIISSSEVEYTVNGSGNVSLGNQNIIARYSNFKIKEKKQYPGYQQTISGKYSSNYTNGTVNVQTINPLQFDYYDNPVSGQLNLLTYNSTISIQLNNGSYTIYRNGKFLKTVSNMDLSNLFK